MTTLERLKNRFTTPYNTESGSNLDKLLQQLSTPMDEMYGVADDVVDAHHLQDATGHSLDKWGDMFQVLRGIGESDDHYRARVVTQSIIYHRSATVQDMVSSCANVLSVPTTRISISDGGVPASFSMLVYLTDAVASGLSLADFSYMMQSAKAAGVNLSLTGLGSFECKSISGVSDPTKGYNNLANANPTGGVYAGLI